MGAWRGPDDLPGPEARYEAREPVSLAFLAALQHLPPAQRAAFLLREVAGFRAAEAADILDCTDGTINALVRQARAGIARYLDTLAAERLGRPRPPPDKPE